MIVTLYDADQQPHVLACPSDDRFHLGTNFGIAGMAPAVHSRQVLAGTDGSVITGTRRPERRIPLPMRIIEADTDEMLERIHDLAKALKPESVLRLRVDRAGVSREITCRYEAGAEQLAVADIYSPTVLARLVLVADSPFWYRVDTPVASFGPETFVNAFSAGGNEVTVVNVGDVEVFPEITVTGVAENILILNERTGKNLRIIERLDYSSDVAVIRCGGRGQAGWTFNGRGDVELLDADSDLSFGFVPGNNPLLISAVNAQGDNVSLGSIRFEWVDLFDSC